MADTKKKATEVHVTSFPFVTQEGSIMVPEEVMKEGEESIREYISDNFDDIDFSDPDFDYAGSNFDISF